MSEPVVAPDRSISHRRWFWWTIAFLTVALLVAAAGWWLRPGSTSPPVAPTSAADLPRAGETPVLPVTGVFIEPGDGRAPLLDEIRAARRSIDLEVYIISDDVILRALEEAQQRGVDVRVILEEQPFGG